MEKRVYAQQEIHPTEAARNELLQKTREKMADPNISTEDLLRCAETIKTFTNIEKSFLDHDNSQWDGSRLSFTRKFAGPSGSKVSQDRTLEFWTDGKAKELENLKLKLEFCENTHMKFVYILKENEGYESPTRMKVSMFVVPKLVKDLEKLLQEIETTPMNKMISRLEHPDASIDDKNDPRFWNPEFTVISESGNLKIRPDRSKSGVYYFRFFTPLSKPSEKFVNWKGSKMILFYNQLKWFVAMLNDFIRDEEKLLEEESTMEVNTSADVVEGVAMGNDAHLQVD